AQNVVLKSGRSRKDANVLEKSLSRRCPDLEFHEALQEEKEKLHIELHQSKVNNDPKQCLVIEHLIDVMENVVNVPMERNMFLASQPFSKSRTTDFSLGTSGLQSENPHKLEWQADLFSCCSEPCLSKFLKPHRPDNLSVHDVQHFQ
ncbi:hypothetical protein RJ639_003200, partial [Escallonia herrerae]